MLVQHFFPSSSTPTHTNSSLSPPLLMQNKKKRFIHSPFFNFELTGFQPTISQTIRMNYSENIKTNISAWPRKLTSVMDIHRQRFSQINQKFKQRPIANLHQPISTNHMCPIILPQASRPQPRQQARTKQQIQTHFPPPPPNRRSNTAHVRNQQQPFMPNPQYITLANLTKILHVLQTNDSDTATDISSSTTNSAKQRVQQHLQETATRWWKPIRLSDSYPASPSIHTTATSTVLQQPTEVNNQLQENIPLLTVISNSTQQWNRPLANLKCDESETSTETQPTTVRTTFVLPPKPVNTQRTRQEPLIMQARGMRIHSYDHRYYTNHNNMNFFQQQRLIRQT